MLPQNCKYLGNPLFIKKKKVDSFEYILDKMKTKLRAWMSKTLSWVARTILTKSVFNSISIYFISAFKLPIKTCDKVNKLIRDFWWDKVENDGKYFTQTR